MRHPKLSIASCVLLLSCNFQNSVIASSVGSVNKNINSSASASTSKSRSDKPKSEMMEYITVDGEENEKTSDQNDSDAKHVNADEGASQTAEVNDDSTTTKPKGGFGGFSFFGRTKNVELKSDENIEIVEKEAEEDKNIKQENEDGENVTTDISVVGGSTDALEKETDADASATNDTGNSGIVSWGKKRKVETVSEETEIDESATTTSDGENEESKVEQSSSEIDTTLEPIPSPSERDTEKVKNEDDKIVKNDDSTGLVNFKQRGSGLRKLFSLMGNRKKDTEEASLEDQIVEDSTNQSEEENTIDSDKASGPESEVTSSSSDSKEDAEESVDIPKDQDEPSKETNVTASPIVKDNKIQPLPLSNPMMPMGPSTPPLILFSPPNGVRPPPGMRSPRGIPPSPTDATINGLLHALLPLLSRLLLLTILSSSSSLFGHGDSQVYSPEPSQHFMLERVNDRYLKDGIAMKKALECPPGDVSKQRWSFAMKKRKSWLKKELGMAEGGSKNSASLPKPFSRYSRTVIVMEVQTLDSDMDTVVAELRDAVTFIISQYNDNRKRVDMGKDLEIVVCIESPGGVVQDFGLAADQLNRLKEAGATRNDLSLTVCVDKIAASGGYMMACQASPGKLLAAPFSVLGSIGVLRETINVHDVLEKYGIKPLMLKAGDAKVPLTQTTKVTEESIAMVQKNLDKVHEAFRELVMDTRGNSVTEHFDEVTNGDIFLGKDAAKYGLVDRIMTSDEYISEKFQAGDRVLRLHKYDRSRVGLRLSPLDLLLLRSNGLLGKSLTSALKNAVKLSSQLMRVGATMGMMKVLDKSYCHLSTRRRPQDNI